MSIRDLNRSRKVYSFFRVAPRALPSSTSGTSGTELLTYSTIAALQAQSVTDFSSGELVYVQSVRDFFVLETTLMSGTLDSIQNIAALNNLGVWYRLGLGGNFWKNQTTWYINSDSGSDENPGSQGQPLASIDELVRRFLGLVKITSDYTINLTSTTSSIANTMGMNIDFDGGSVLFQGYPALQTNLGTIVSLSGAVNYSANTSGSAPWTTLSSANTAFFSSSVLARNCDLLYASASTETPVLGWAVGGQVVGNTANVFTTATTLTSSAGRTLWKSSVPTINTPGIIARGFGDVIFDKVKIGVSTSANVVLGGADPAAITLRLSSFESASPELAGGNIFLDRSRVRSTSGSIFVHNNTKIYGSGSAFTSPSKQINLRDSYTELGSSVIADSSIVVRGGKLILSVPLASGCVLLGSSSVEVQSNSIVDVRNLIMTMSTMNGSADTTHVMVTGQNCTVFYDSSNTPKANNVTINNGYAESFTWSQMPYQEIGTNTLVASGSLKSLLNPTD